MVGRRDFYLTDDIPAKYDPKKHCPEWETKESLRREHRRRVNFLRDHLCDDEADVLDECSGGQRCGSTICVKCGTRFHRWIGANLLRVFSKFPTIHMVTWVPDPVYPPRDERVWWPDRIANTFIRRIERYCPPDVVMAGCVELGMNTTLRCLTPHVHAIVAKASREELLAAHPGKPEDRLIYHPWRVSEPIPDNERMRVMTYIGKVFQPRRRFRVHWSERKAFLAARARKLIPVTDLEENWMLAMHRYIPADLLLLKNLSRENSSVLRVYPLERRRKLRYREHRPDEY